MSKPFRRWRIYPDPDVPSRYVAVELWPTLKTMRKRIREYAGPATGRAAHDAAAACLTNPDDRALCLLVFAKEWLVFGTVAHEAFHAGLVYARHVATEEGATLDGDLEEQVATFVGRLCTGIVARANERGDW